MNTKWTPFVYKHTASAPEPLVGGLYGTEILTIPVFKTGGVPVSRIFVRESPRSLIAMATFNNSTLSFGI